MKYLIAVLVSAFLGTAFAFPAADLERAKASFNRIKEAHKFCNEDPTTHVDIDAFKKAREDGGEEPANVPAHILCVSKHVRWQNDDGSLNEADLKSRIKAALGDGPEYEEAIRDCLKVLSTAEATARSLYDCHRKHTPRPNGTHASPH